ncbi:hypothetical protein DPSP01_010737 [Paraphaeosphaeria sporulosa]|uniref:UPF0157-domain-containing protein n=1 Tax=Paraphaeosphaeria sporulosa TaxID=1460663 RepID=A0A177CXF4_9PLEO|nr:UPF0157-domain-containing protein [Paraphaeosphaeria sporulosa]OAG11582.1 UPF0157-domain-containing protein [Paraphaeosphaeria sporulosa]
MSVEVHPHNPAWSSQFLAIKERLERLLKDVPYKSIEHVGSTSVPGLVAKPIIDIDIIVARNHVQTTLATLTAAGFTDMGELGIKDRWCVKDPEQEPKRNVYVCVEGAIQTRNHLALRDTLRRDEKLRNHYAHVKLGLAAKGVDIVEYVEGKSAIIEKILRAAGTLSEEDMGAVSKANKRGERIGAIKTERLVLREFVWGDVEAYFGLESREEVVRYQNWGPRTREQVGEQVAEIVKGSAAVPRTHFELAVEHEGRFIGRVGAKVKKDGIAHADLWFSFLPECQGRGFATEAMKAFIPLLSGPLELEIECDPRNTGSWKLAERLGFERFELTEKAFECKGEWVDSLVYRKQV